MPVRPNKNTINILSGASLGRCPSIFMVKKIRKKEAMKNRIKAAENGSIL